MSKTGQTARPYTPAAMAFLFTSVIEFFVPAPQALASTFLRRVWRGLPVESPSRRSCQVPQGDRTARTAAEWQKQKIAMLVQVTPALSQTLDPNPAWTCPVRAPHHSCHQGNIIDPRLRFHYIIHSSHTSKRCICNCCISTLRVASPSGSHLIRYEWQLTKV